QVGERQRVLVTEESFDSQFYVAHNQFYEQVLVPKNPEFMGKMVEVDIYEAGKHFMKGRPVSDANVFTPSITRPLAKGQVSGITEARESFEEQKAREDKEATLETNTSSSSPDGSVMPPTPTMADDLSYFQEAH
ncbi:CDK5 regulatory subunit-associated protein 1-like 1, partial [Chelonia mydas]